MGSTLAQYMAERAEQHKKARSMTLADFTEWLLRDNPHWHRDTARKTWLFATRAKRKLEKEARLGTCAHCGQCMPAKKRKRSA